MLSLYVGSLEISYFLQHAAMIALQAAVYAAAYPSICRSVSPSVHPLHFGILSKRRNAEGCGLHHRVCV